MRRIGAGFLCVLLCGIVVAPACAGEDLLPPLIDKMQRAPDGNWVGIDQQPQ